MIIEEPDFRLEAVDGDVLWDLELLHTVKPKNGPERQEFQNEAYGVSLSSALRRIVRYRIEQKTSVLNLKQYVDEYKKQVNELTKLVKGVQ